MRPHISLDVRDVAKSVAFYENVFGVRPQKQVGDYAKFDLTSPALNLFADFINRGDQYR